MLKIYRFSGNQYRTAGVDRMIKQREQIGKTFADSGGGFDTGIFAVFQCTGNGKCHNELLGALLADEPLICTCGIKGAAGHEKLLTGGFQIDFTAVGKFIIDGKLIDVETDAALIIISIEDHQRRSRKLLMAVWR